MLTGGTLEPTGSNKKGKGKEVSQASQDAEEDTEGQENEDANEETSARKKQVYSKDKVRVSQANRTLDSMFPIAGPSSTSTQQLQASQAHNSNSLDSMEDRNKWRDGVNVLDSDEPAQEDRNRVKLIKESQCFLKSVKALREEVYGLKHECKLWYLCIQWDGVADGK